MSIKIALAGNPNSGKTTLFNALTGANQFVGNWPGVTVEKKEGKLKGTKEVIITDTIVIPEEKRFDKLVQISVAELLAYTIESIENDLPVSDVFKHFDFKGE